jgi:hypothetical protein
MRQSTEYREEQNPVNMFITENCDQVDENESNPILVSTFAEKFSHWAGKTYDVRRSHLCSGALVTRSTSARLVDRSG